MIRLSEQNGGVFQNVDEVIEKVRQKSNKNVEIAYGGSDEDGDILVSSIPVKPQLV